MATIEDEIRQMAKRYAVDLQEKIEARTVEMQTDDTSHFLIYRVLGISAEEGQRIDLYQNRGRFLYNAAGRFLEEATKLCFVDRFPAAGSVTIPNSRGSRPRTFEVDCLVDANAIEIKWRDATTDGDHITKEHTRISAIVDAGYRPVRVMFYYPNRAQAIRIQETLATLYAGIGGEYYFGDDAWAYVEQRTAIKLKTILEKLADEKMQ